MSRKCSRFSRLSLCVSILILGAQGAWGAITGSEHDFSGTSWADGEICKPCHTPHHAENVQDAPLWNHELSTATYILYSSPTMDVPVGQPGPVSKLCLACHDGTIALESFGGQTGSTMISGTANIGTDLSGHHPIGMDWDHQTMAGGGPCNTCHTMHGGAPSFLSTSVQFYDGKVECASCHDVHNGSNLPSLVRVTMTASTMCIICHTDK